MGAVSCDPTQQAARKGLGGFYVQPVPSLKLPKLKEASMQHTAITPPGSKAFKNFAGFYPFYLTEHSNVTCRRLHFVGSSLTLVCLAMPIASGKP